VGVLALFGKYFPGLHFDTFSLTESPAIVLVDFPQTAKFLTPDERAFVIWRKSMSLFAMSELIIRTVSFFLIHAEYDNSSVGEEEKFAARHVWAAFADWQVCICVLSGSDY